MADEKIEVEVELEINGKKVKGTLKKLGKQAKKSGKKAGNNFGSSFAKGARSNLLKLGATAIAIAGTIATALAGKKVIAAAALQEDAVNRLNAALVSSGTFSKEASQDLQNYAAAMERTTVFGDELILQQLALAKAFGATNEGAKDVVTAATELAIAADINLTEAVRRVGRAFSGSIEDVAKFAPEIKNLTKEQLRAGDASKELIKALTGGAAAQLNTFSGLMKNLGNRFGTLQEEIGKILISSPSVIKLFRGIGAVIDKLAEQVVEFGKRTDDPLKKFVNNLLAIVGLFNQFVVPAIAGISRAVVLVANAIDATLDNIVSKMTTVTNVMSGVAKLLGREGAFTQSLDELGEKADQTADESLTKLKESLSTLFDPIEFQENMNEYLAIIRDTVENTDDLTNKLSASFKKSSKEISKDMKKTAFEIAGAINQLMTKVISTGIQAMTASLFLGEKGFENFGKKIAGIMGEMAIQLGETLVLTGIGMTSLLALNGGAAVAAGAGLIALGTILKSFSGGVDALTAPAGNADGFASTGGGIGSGDSDSATGFSEEREEPSTAVSVQINGDVLDSEETGIRIVQILNDAFEQDGVVVTGNPT